VIPKVLYTGSSSDFLKRMSAFADTLPDLFRRIDGLKLSRSYTGLKPIKFLESPVNGEKIVYDRSRDEITIHPSNFTAGDRIDAFFFKALGKRHWEMNVSSTNKIKWANQYCFVKEALIDRLSEFMHGKLSFKEVISMFTTAVDKLIVIHILNALTHNSVTPSQLQSIDFKNHASVKDFVEGRKPYSLKPLLSTYGGDVRRLSDYSECFSEWCLNRGNFKITETSTKEEFKDLFLAVSS